MADVITKAELASFLQVVDVDNATADLAIQGAQGTVKRYAPRAFIASGSHTIVLPVHHGVATLPRPVTAVTSVSWIVGTGTTVAASGWGFDGIATLSGLDYRATGSGQQLTQYPPPTSVQVVYTGGYAAVPADVKAIVLALAGRMYDNPNGLRSTSVTVGQFTETEQYAGDGADLASAQLLPSELRTLRSFRRTAGTSRLG